MPIDEPKVATASTASARIIAAGIVIAFCYFASSVLVTLLVAVLMTYFLDPVVTWLERIHIPRALGSLVVVLTTVALLAVLAGLLMSRLDEFGADWPQYRAPLQAAARAVEKKMAALEAHVSELTPGEKPGASVVTVADSHPLRDALLVRLSTFYELIFAATFEPFLIFFMLAAKRQVWHATMQLFPATERTEVKEAPRGRHAGAS